MFSDKKYDTIIDRRKKGRPVDLQTLKDFSLKSTRDVENKDMLTFELMENSGERKYSHDVPVVGGEQHGGVNTEEE